MIDLIPLGLGLLGVALAIWAILALMSKKNAGDTRRATAIVLAPIAVIAFAYLAFAVIDGDPDVWDFYASIWWVPLAAGAVFALFAARALAAAK
ncbi:MAG: hypothetical protein PGN24_01350 [Microbacterium arborescens]